jgi:hypothetical protein
MRLILAAIGAIRPSSKRAPATLYAPHSYVRACETLNQIIEIGT